MYEIQYELRSMNSISKSNIFVVNLDSKDILRIFSSFKKKIQLKLNLHIRTIVICYFYFSKLFQNKWWKWKFLSPAWKEKEIQIKYDEHMGIYGF